MRDEDDIKRGLVYRLEDRVWKIWKWVENHPFTTALAIFVPWVLVVGLVVAALIKYVFGGEA